MQDANGLAGSGSISFLTGPLAGSTFPVSKSMITIGREPGNDIIISDPSVSRHHAQIAWKNGSWIINKLAAQNIVTVNSREVQQATINNHDTIGIGTGTTFLFTVNTGTEKAANAPPASAAPFAPLRPPVVPPPAPSPFISSQPAAPKGSPPAQSFVPPPAPYNPTVAVPPVQNPYAEAGTQRAAGPGQFTPPAGGQGIPSLEIQSNIAGEKPTYDLTRPVINIGREPSNDIVIDAPVVSGFHAQIVREGNQLILVHPHPSRPQTTNGLLYQGRHILGNEHFRKPLVRGDIFRIGDEHGTLVTLTYNDGSGAPQEIVPEIRPIPLGVPVLTIGRLPQPTNMVVLNHPQVSGRHAELRQEQGGYRIIDLGSTNHVYVNAQRVTNQLLKPGDEIRIGPFKLTYTGTQLTQQDESHSIRIDALHLKKVGSKQTILINDISLAIPPRKFVALVGGSGAGKSTLMDALNGLRPAQQGAVLYNGTDYYRHLAAFSTQMGYVPQDDILHRDLTVERALYYAAKMRLPEDYTEEQVKQRIDEVLDDVEMKFRRKLLVSKLSGGQRKRVSIALELLANPSVFFLDEPTSGLDPGLDRKMMFLLRNLADKGHTIVLVTHATNNINACDYVCFLAQGGHLAYYGPPNEAKTFFGKTDFAEIYSALEPTEENKNIPAEAEARFKASPDYQKYVADPLNQGPAGRANVQQQTVEVKLPKRGNPWKQFRQLSERYLELLWNDKGNLSILLLQAPIIAMILFFLVKPDVFSFTNVVTCPPQPQVPRTSLINNDFDCNNIVNALNTPQGQSFAASKGLTRDEALQNSINPASGGEAQKILFIMAFAAVMFGTINGTREIVKEAPIYKRERTVNLGIAPYLFSKIAVLGTLCLLQSLMLAVLVNIRAPFSPNNPQPFHQGVFLPIFLEIYITLVLTSLAALMVGLAISAIAPNNDRATSFIPIILVPQVIFSGIIFPLNGPVMQFLGAFFAARWAMAGLGSSIGLHGDKLGADDFSFQGMLFTHVDPHQGQGGATVHLIVVWFALVVMIVLLGLLTAYFLKRKDIRA